MNHLSHPDKFINRHIGPLAHEQAEMLKLLDLNSLDELVEQVVPTDIRDSRELEVGNALSEAGFLRELKRIAAENQVFKSYIGLGYHETLLPSVILRNILENPGWYTQYTPYQAEISQGRLEALLNFQTMVSDLTGLPVANASLLDEGTAAAEAISMTYGHKHKKDRKSTANTVLVSDRLFAQTIDVIRTRTKAVGIKLVIADEDDFEITDDVFAAIVQYPGELGTVRSYSKLADELHAKKSYLIVAADLMSLAVLQSPASFGADVVLGNSQRLGVPMGFGGPHAAFFAAKDDFLRLMPGRIIGVSIDSNGSSALRMTLQTREQHIKRGKATSNICTAQALLAIMAGMYAVWHGPQGLHDIAARIHKMTSALDFAIQQLGIEQINKTYFDTLCLRMKDAQQLQKVKDLAEEMQINFRYIGEQHIGISLNEATEPEDAMDILGVLASATGKMVTAMDFGTYMSQAESHIPTDLSRKVDYLSHPVFNTYHSETAMMRYLKRLEKKDLALNTAMIPLGSCTMKLNAATEMLPLTWAEFGNIHPFSPTDQTEGYTQIIEELGEHLCDITGFADISFQPNSGAQGEYTGLMVIRAWHESRGESHRNIALIPSSAHGTNPASAVMAGMKVIVVKTDESGNIDVGDLKEKTEKYAENLACLMVTYPSTFGLFEEGIREMCELIHSHGGQVYMDGANMNAQVGLTSPGFIGADVCHLNLHKTFAIPHGGGGPGMGPICVAEHLCTFLPGHSLYETGGERAISSVSSAPFGSAFILLISYAYIKMLGSEGLTKATQLAILSANYMKARLEKYYPVLYQNKAGRVGHEFILDLRSFKHDHGLDTDDITKRLIDYGFHAPTVSWPVAGTIMTEPTESEPKSELDRFCDAMIAIRSEIDCVASGEFDAEDNVLKNSPHTLGEITADDWPHPYSRSQAAFPVASLREDKFWPSVARVDNTYGDRHVVCTCPPVEAYE